MANAVEMQSGRPRVVRPDRPQIGRSVMTNVQNVSPMAWKSQNIPEQLAQECLAEAGGNRDRAIALGRKRLREIYLAEIKRAEFDYFNRVRRLEARRKQQLVR